MPSTKAIDTPPANYRHPAPADGALTRRHMRGALSSVSGAVLVLATGLTGAILSAPAAMAADYTVGTADDLVNLTTGAIVSDGANVGGATGIKLSNDVTVNVGVPVATAPFLVNIDTAGDFTLTLDGPGAAWNTGSYDTVVVDGSTGGGLTLSGGAKLEIHNNPNDVLDPTAFFDLESGNLKVTGDGTSLTTNQLTVGRGNNSTVTISAGAHVVAEASYMGEAPPGAPGANTHATSITVVVDGNDTVWDAGYFVAGGAADNVKVTLSGGAVINGAHQSSIGRNGNATMEVTGADSKFIVSGELRVGERMPWVDAGAFPGLGDGKLTIKDGGLVSAMSVSLARTGTDDHDAGINGDLVVDPNGTLETGELWQGYGTGKATFQNGTLRATGNSASLIHSFDPGNFVLQDEGMFLDSNGFDVLAESAMSGNGDLTKLGEGKLTVIGANIYEGVTYVDEGTLAAGVANTFSAESDHRVAANALLDLQGYNQTVESLYNAGNVSLGGAPGTTLSVLNDYVGAGGIIYLNTALGDDNSITDLVDVDGASTGISSIKVTNVGGTGDQTDEGIRIIDVAGASAGHFDLIGDYVFEGDQAVVGGLYAYRLYQGSTSVPGDGDWYLRSTLIPSDPGDPGGPLYQPGVPLYETYPQILSAYNELGTLQQRVGNRSWTGSDSTEDVVDLGDRQIETNGVWGRIEGAHAHDEFDTTSGGTSADSNLWRLQAGLDGVVNQAEHGALVGGVNLSVGTINADVSSVFGDGSIRTNAFGLGGTLTWYDDSGFYLDGVAQLHWFDSTLSTAGLDVVSGNNGFGYALSLEAGRQIALGDQWSITPQAQLVYNNVSFDDFTDTFGTAVGLADGGGRFNGRLGITLDYDDAAQGDNGLARTHLYGIANLYYDFDTTTEVNVAGTSLTASTEQLSGSLGIGGSYNWDDDKYSLYGEASMRTGLEDPGANYSLHGNVGLKVSW